MHDACIAESEARHAAALSCAKAIAGRWTRKRCCDCSTPYRPTDPPINIAPRSDHTVPRVPVDQRRQLCELMHADRPPGTPVRTTTAPPHLPPSHAAPLQQAKAAAVDRPGRHGSASTPAPIPSAPANTTAPSAMGQGLAEASIRDQIPKLYCRAISGWPSGGEHRGRPTNDAPRSCCTMSTAVGAQRSGTSRR